MIIIISTENYCLFFHYILIFFNLETSIIKRKSMNHQPNLIDIAMDEIKEDMIKDILDSSELILDIKADTTFYESINSKN